MDRLTLRLPEKLHKELKELAEKEKRSLNSQILYILTVYIERRKKSAEKPKG